ncbi:MAG TPA: nucleoside-diphosphate sugar epimerase/dehydratase [Gemmatimonadota bacterium]|nr:nucleoside-diphosphate sugar epimerase/dehydratase [Gemmatimonadota bacterium]
MKGRTGRSARWIDRAMGYRGIALIGLNAILFALIYWLSYELRFDFAVTRGYVAIYVDTVLAVVAIKTVVFQRYSLHQGLWRYVSITDLERIIQAALVSTVFLVATFFLVYRTRDIPRSVIALDFLLTILVIGGVRFAVRMLRETYRPMRGERGRRVLVVGAGAAGEQALREIRLNRSLGFDPVGLVDDDRRKKGGAIHGVQVLGTTEQLQSLVLRHRVEEILIAIPSATGREVRRIVEQCEALKVRFQILPAVGDLIAGRVSIRQFREVQIEDLLGRERVELDVDRLGGEIAGRTILVTGAGGSIGSELVRQVLDYGPRRVLLVDRSENGIFAIDRELRERSPADDRLVPIVGDIQDGELVREIFDRWRPSLVYHAAAYKHVPLMETSVLEAVRNNVLGTRSLMDAAERFNADRFVLISTDKAVRPKNVMGATKRMAELLMLERGGSRTTKFVAVRFGNVLASEGSVLPIFRRQLAAGGPLTGTDAEATRYFMTIPEAVQLVMQAGTMGKGGEIFVLDMGEPIRIVDLAHRLITLAGKRPGEDVEIVFTGLRPGEKLHEDLVAPGESVQPTPHEKIRMLAGARVPPGHYRGTIAEMERCVAVRDADRALGVLMEAVTGAPPGGPGRVIPLSAS